MSQRSYEHLKAQWPGRWWLTAEEVALVLNSKSGKGAADWIREQMKRGDLKGAERNPVGGGWRLPLPDLAEIVEPTPDKPSLPVGPRQVAAPKRRRAAIGPSLDFIRTGRFFLEVYKALGWQAEIEAMNEMLAAEELNLRVAYSDRQREALDEGTPVPDRVNGRGGRGL